MFSFGTLWISNFMWQSLLDITTIIAGFAAAISVFYLAKQIKVSIEQQKIQKSYEYLRRFNDYNFRESAKRASAFLKKLDKAIHIEILANRKDEESIEIKSHVLLLMNFFEEMGTMYKKELVDRELLKDFFCVMSIDYQKQAQYYIDYRKKTDDPLFFENWEWMNRHITDGQSINMAPRKKY